MTTSLPQIIPLGSTELVEMTVTARDLTVDLTSDVIQVCVTDAAAKNPLAPAWVTPTIRSHPTAYSVQVGLLIGPAGGLGLQVGKWRLWMRLVASPEVPWIPAVRIFRVVS